MDDFHQIVEDESAHASYFAQRFIEWQGASAQTRIVARLDIGVDLMAS